MSEMNPTKGIPPLMTARLDPDRSDEVCHWFLECDAEAYADVEHPTLGTVPTCERHLTWLLEDS